MVEVAALTKEEARAYLQEKPREEVQKSGTAAMNRERKIGVKEKNMEERAKTEYLGENSYRKDPMTNASVKKMERGE